MAELLSTQYASVFSVPKEAAGEPTAFKTEKKLVDITFTSEDMELAISELRSNAAAGDDGFPAVLLKNCKSALLLQLFSGENAWMKATYHHD